MNEHARAHLKRWGMGLFEGLVIAASLLLLTYFYVFGVHEVDGVSMAPTYETGEVVLIDKWMYKRVMGLNRGDVVVFQAPVSAHCLSESCDFIKRVVGLPGDDVRIQDGDMWVNDERVANNERGLYRPGEWVVPNGYMFVVGDNYAESSDSRDWGFVEEGAVKGRVFMQVLPMSELGFIEGGLGVGFSDLGKVLQFRWGT